MKNSIVIVTSCAEDWGGSEELWAKGIPVLMKAGHQVILVKREIAFGHPKFMELSDKGVVLKEIYPRSKSFRKRLLRRLKQELWALGNSKTRLPDFVSHRETRVFERYLQQVNPALVIISQGINFDGLAFGYPCLKLNIPYVIIAQKAVDFYWPTPDDRGLMKQILLHAKRCFFVSKHNLRLTEEQFGTKLANGEVIFNPVKITTSIPYPSSQSGYRLCCIARLFILDKGQDMLLRVLSQSKWKQRPIHVTFIGKGIDREALIEMAELLGVSNVSFEEHTDHIEKVWKTHHALVLPSRSEGLPLTIMEAMMAGRPVITTNAGGNAELLQEGMTGYVAQPFENSLDDALERAWQQREHWEEVGERASRHLVQQIPASPELVFGEKILGII